MQVILLEKVQRLGNLGDEVAVKSGFGRNFLVPTGKALPANKRNRDIFATRRAELEEVAAKLQAEAEQRKVKLVAAGDVNIKANAGIEGKLFGSVGAIDIADELNTAGANIQRNEVRLPAGPLRHTGEFDIDIQLHADVIVTVRVNITSEAQQLAEAEAELAEAAKAEVVEEEDEAVIAKAEVVEEDEAVIAKAEVVEEDEAVIAKAQVVEEDEAVIAKAQVVEEDEAVIAKAEVVEEDEAVIAKAEVVEEEDEAVIAKAQKDE